jgi:AraC-like DNA-binding protein
MIDLSYMDHEGNDGPHLNREVDLKLKTDLQNYYYCVFEKDEYKIPEIAKILKKSEKYIYKHFRKSKELCRGIQERRDHQGIDGWKILLRRTNTWIMWK